MYTPEQCLAKLENCPNSDILSWKIEYEKAVKREQTQSQSEFDFAQLMVSLQSNSFARSNQSTQPKPLKAFDKLEMFEDESIELFNEAPVSKPKKIVEEDCPSCEIVAKRRGRKPKGSK